MQSKAVCAWWNNATAAYDPSGCVNIPSPQPPGHNLSWVSNFSTTNDTALALAWTLSGPLFNASLCTLSLLDCSMESPLVFVNGTWTDANATLPRIVYPDPSSPLSVAAISCPPFATVNVSVGASGARQCVLSSGVTGPCPVLRVYSGAACALRQPNNSLACTWDNQRQSFTGCGCVPDPVASTQCACRHLTEFASSAAPSIPTCSLSDMLSLNPADIVTKLKMLFIVVIVLFSVMNVGALIGWWQDKRERSTLVEGLQSPEVGFRISSEGAWLWAFSLHQPTDNELASSLQRTPRGPAVRLTELMGVPFSRLRLAIPDEALSWRMGDALGRRAALSATDLRREHEERISRGKTSEPKACFDRRPLFERLVSSSKLTDTDGPIHGDEFMGTAIVLGFIQANCMVPAAKLRELQVSARRHFEGTATTGGWGFAELASLWCIAFDGNLNTETGWLPITRLLRLVLSQSVDGSWEAGPDTAFAVLARQQEEVDAMPKSPFALIAARARVLLACLQSDADGDADDGNDDDAAEDAAAAAAARGGAADDDAVASGGDEAALVMEALRAAEIHDCPLEGSTLALHQTLPRDLARLPPAAAAPRVWATLCSLAVLQRLRVGWLVGDGEAYYEHELTVVDSATEWLRRHAEAHPGLAAALARGNGLALRRRADKTTALWLQAWKHRISLNRREEALTSKMTRYHIERASVKMARAAALRHETFSSFLAPAGRARRWQSFMAIVTLVISTLFVQVWMFWVKGENCCVAIRAVLNAGVDGGNCPPSSSGADPCRGYTGNCGDLISQFADVPILPDYPNGLADYECSGANCKIAQPPARSALTSPSSQHFPMTPTPVTRSSSLRSQSPSACLARSSSPPCLSSARTMTPPTRS